MDVSALEYLGLTALEIKVYTSLLKLGSVKVGDIIRTSGLQSSSVHNALQSLISRGFVSFIKKGKIRRYAAADPSLFLVRYEDKKEELQQVVAELHSLQVPAEEKEDAELFEGFKGISAMLNELIKDAKQGDCYYFFAMDVGGMNKEIQDFFRWYDAKRKNKGLTVMGMAPTSQRHLFENRKYLKMKYVSYPIPANISICNDKMAMISWGEKPKGILLRSKQLVQSQVGFFMTIWGKKF
ncbi:MAG: helix-turn-helix domain-containing protein [Candidatus Micrarchaeota archaeon]